MKIELPKLPYEIDALEPTISARALQVHHRDYHLAYVAKLSNLIPGTRFENADLVTMIKKADGHIFYYASQIWNHTFYFNGINPKREYNLNGRLAEAIQNSFSSFMEFREAFTQSAASDIVSGWAWLIVNENGMLEIVQNNNTENPLRRGMRPILVVDLCRHAYDLDYNDNRIDYINSYWSLINWEIVEKRFCNVCAKNGFKHNIKTPIRLEFL